MLVTGTALRAHLAQEQIDMRAMLARLGFMNQSPE